MGSPADYAHAGWALGYAEDGIFPIPRGARDDHDAACDSAILHPHPGLVGLVTEAGRHAGRASALERQRLGIETHHREVLSAVLALLLAKVDISAVVAAAVALAATEAALGANPVQRRRAVANAVRSDLDKARDSDIRSAWQSANEAGYIAATAQGYAEADSSDGKAPPRASQVDKVRDAAILAVPAMAALSTAAVWADEQISTLAMGVALAAGDGKALSDATKAATEALSNGDRALKTFGHQLHRQMISALVDSTVAMHPAAQANFQTEGDSRVCPTCYEIAGLNPYRLDSVPRPPVHFTCRCWLYILSAADVTV